MRMIKAIKLNKRRKANHYYYIPEKYTQADISHILTIHKFNIHQLLSQNFSEPMLLSNLRPSSSARYSEHFLI